MQWVKTSVLLCAAQALCACTLLGLAPSSQEFPEPSPTPAPPVSRLEPPSPDKDCGGRFSQDQRMYVELVQKMVEQGQYYAAIAHLNQLEKTTAAAPQTTYLRAEALRGTGRRDDAEKLYRGLLGGCMAGYGLHGLGLLAAESGQLRQAQEFLERASRERPVDAQVHNDLGMMLLLNGRRDDARREFQTAVELDPKDRLPQENLIVLMLMENQQAEAQRLARERGITESDMERLAERAKHLGQRRSGKR